MKLLIITHDEIDRLDRRTLCQARVFVEHAWEVDIILPARSRMPVVREAEPGIRLHGRPFWMFEPPHDPLFHGSEQPTVRSVARSKLAVVSRYLTSTFSLARRLRMLFPTPAEYYPLPYTLGFLEQARDREFDAVMACDLPALPPAAELSRRRNVPLIYDSHEYYSEQGTFTQRQKDVLIFHERRDVQQAALSYTVSDLIAAELTENYHLARPMRVLYNAPSFEASIDDCDGAAVRKRVGIPEGAVVLLFHGGFMRGRNLDRLIDGFSDLDVSNVLLVLLGFGDEVEALKKQARRVGRGEVLVCDAVPQDELPHWIAASDAVVIPYPARNIRNNEFCMPNKFLDCVELRRPVIANSGLRMISHFIERFGVGFTGPMETPGEMRETLSAALDWLKRDGLQDAGFEDARQYLGAETQRRKLCAWLGEIGLSGFERHTSPHNSQNAA